MLAEHKLKVFEDFLKGLSNDEITWVNGYLNGVVSKTSAINESAASILKPAVSKITITYGTETGNSKKIATDFAAKAKKSGINVKLVSLDQYRLNDLAKEEYFFTVVSTHGDGEPPAASKKFYDHIHSNGFKVDKLKYSVLALGDTSYPLFCKTGEDIDAQLSNLGGKRIASLQKCDIDFDAEAEEWLANIFRSLSEEDSGSVTTSPVITKKRAGKKTFTASVLSHTNLNDKGSAKETYHIEIEADDDVSYKPGDSIGIIPQNNKQLVEHIISLSGIDVTTNIDHKDELISVYDVLHKKLNIVYLPERVVKHYAAVVKKEIPVKRYDLSELLEQFPINNADQFIDVIKILEPITPRLYSIASSPEAHSGEVHITVARDSFKIENETKYGLASNFLSQFSVGEKINFYIHPNNQFRLPGEDKNVIMIGPGTGIAPFRSFIAERDATGASGKNWLFFGDQHFATDFLYQTEIQSWYETGVLTKVNLAFSRDQPQKIYVQHKMLQHGAEFFEWLNTGCYVYVCGAKEPMSVDVEKTLLQIIEQFGERSNEEAIQYLDRMKEDGRYIKDVY